MSDFWANITYEQILRVQSGRYSMSDPCVVCGALWETCIHGAAAVSFLIKRVKALTKEQWEFIKRRDSKVKTTTEKAEELVAKANELLKAAEELKAQAAKEEATKYKYPPEPKGLRFCISVRHRGTSYWYDYLVRRVPGKGYYTTSRSAEAAHFANWRKFVDWIRSDDVVANSGLETLVLSEHQSRITLP